MSNPAARCATRGRCVRTPRDEGGAVHVVGQWVLNPSRPARDGDRPRPGSSRGCGEDQEEGEVGRRRIEQPGCADSDAERMGGGTSMLCSQAALPDAEGGSAAGFGTHAAVR